MNYHQEKIPYLLDAQGNKIAVLIPIEIRNQWNREDNSDGKRQSVPIKKYQGILKGKGFRGREEENKMRDEWN